MKTYNTYAEAKIENPELEIFQLSNSAFHAAQVCFVACSDSDFSETPDGAHPCNPADHCSTVEEFLKAGYKLFSGDNIISTHGRCVTIGSTGVVGNPMMWNVDDDEKYRYILRAAALNGGSKIPEKKESPQWDGTGLPPVGVECECMYTCDTRPEWLKCVIKYAHDCGDHQVGVLQTDGHPASVFTTMNSQGFTVEFRPLKTPEQIEQEELEQLAYEMYLADHEGVKPVNYEKSKGSIYHEHLILMAKAAKKHFDGKGE